MASGLARLLARLVARLLKRMPSLVWRVLDILINPTAHLRQLGLVIVVQLISVCLRELRARIMSGYDEAVRRQERARSADEWLDAQHEIDSRASSRDERLCDRDQEFFAQLLTRKETYEKLQAEGDEYGLMFHLRAELMRRQAGGAGYNRDGSTWLRKHATARDRIQTYQAAVCNALRYIASGVAAGSSRPGERLAFINETRHAFGRTALLLSGGAAFGVKHLGVVAALHRENLLPRIICGTSAGSIVAATVCVKTHQEIVALLADRGVTSLLRNLKFFGLRRGESGTDLVKESANYLFQTARDPQKSPQKSPTKLEETPRGDSVEWDLRRGRKHMKTTKNLLDSSVLQQTIIELIGGDVTFLEAFDRTGRVLNITVTRSDGKAPPLLCNYLTTPHLIVYSASLASCAIPGVFEPVELMAKGRNGEVEPYFKTGGWRWTDGGLQADLPKERLTELFNVNQFIVSQVNPVAPLFVPVGGTGVPWIEEVNVFLKHQLVGFVQGVSKLGQGKLFRPGGFRGIDLVMQDYEGTVTIRPPWTLVELKDFLGNFDERRVGQYMDDGERATWPQLPLIRSLCEVEFCLDEVASELQRSMAVARIARAAAASASRDGGESPFRSDSVDMMRGKLPSYVSLAAYGDDSEHSPAGGSAAYPVGENGARSRGRLPGVASHASLLNLASLDVMLDEDATPAAGFAPFLT